MTDLRADSPHGKPFGEEGVSLVDYGVGTTWALRHVCDAIELLAQTAPDEVKPKIDDRLAMAREWNGRPLHFERDESWITLTIELDVRDEDTRKVMDMAIEALAAAGYQHLGATAEDGETVTVVMGGPE